MESGDDMAPHGCWHGQWCGSRHVSQFGPHLHSPFGPHLHSTNSTGKNSAFTQPIYQNNNSSPEVTIINYSPNYNLISIMLASQHHDTIIMDHIQFFPCIKTSSIALQDRRQQNTPEHIEEIIGNHQQQLRMQIIPFHHLSVLMRVLWQHIWLPMISSLRGFSSILTASSLTR